MFAKFNTFIHKTATEIKS